MQLAWFTHRYFPFRGGSENFGQAMVRRFVAQGHSIDVITSDAFDLWYFTNPSRERIHSKDVEWIDGARVRRLRVRHFPGQRYVGRLLSRLPSWRLQCCFESYMPVIPGLTSVTGDFSAVVAVGFPYTSFAYGAYRLARRCSAPLVLVPFLHLSTPGDRVHKQYTRPHQIRLLQKADCVVAQTELEVDTLRAWDIPSDRILKLGMAIDRNDVIGGNRTDARKRWHLPEQAHVVGQLGALDPNKGTCDLVRAVESINRARPASDPVYLLLAGPASPAFENFASVLPAECALWLKPLGMIDDADRRHFYAAIDTYAMPSRTDSFGIVFLEAWANRLPVVAARAGGVAEVVTHESTGLLVEFGDVAALTGAIRRLADSRQVAQRLGDTGHAHVSQVCFTWDSRYKLLSDRIAGLLAHRAPQARLIARPHTFRHRYKRQPH